MNFLCLGCNKIKVSDELYKNGKYIKTDKCKKCTNKKHREVYKKNIGVKRIEKKEISRKRRVQSRIKLLGYLSMHPCVDCGESNPVVLEFDHQEKKKINVSQMGNYKWESILKEIKKCEVRCSNCHKIKTSQEQGWYANIKEYYRGRNSELKPEPKGIA